MSRVLTREALEFIVKLAREFQPSREKLLARRVERQKEIDAGGRRDYVFGFIKKFRNHPEFALPDRAQITMTVPFMRA